MAGKQNESNGKKSRTPRRRAEHSNSHTGCMTCKQRRIKCDEETPVCRRCRNAHKVCEPDPRLTKRAWALPNPILSPTVSSRPPAVDGYTESCLRYFTSVTLPAFNRCEPSPLWDYMKQEIGTSVSMRYMATALGHEHRIAAKSTTSAPPQADDYYSQAVQALCAAIVTVGNDKTPHMMFAIVFNCLLLVILQCFRKSFAELNIHLQHGLRIASQATNDPDATTTLPFRESFRLLKQYSIAVALFNPLLPQEAVYQGIATATGNQALADPDDLKATPSTSIMMTDDQVLRDEEQNLLLDLIGTTLTHTKPQIGKDHDGSLEFTEPLKFDTALRETITELRVRHMRLDSAVHQRTLSTNKTRSQHLEVAEARCMLIGIYLRCRWSGYACSYDAERETFRQIVDKLRYSLQQQALDVSDQDTVGSVPAFSIGLGTVAPLFYTAIMCREPNIRLAAIDLLSRCPQQDGPWNAQLAEAISRAVIEYEERAAQEESPSYSLCSYIPEHCRVAYYYYFSTEEGVEHLRIY